MSKKSPVKRRTDIPQHDNKIILDTILQECICLTEASPEGQQLYGIRCDLTRPIYDALGTERGSDFENLIGQTINLYAEAMFAYGLAIGRDAQAALDLPDSGYHHLTS